jgi:hypothetical protein
MPAKSARKLARKSATPRRSRASGGRILTTHVGSLVRPPALREFLAAERDGQRYDEAAFRGCLHDSVAEVVRRQADMGLDIVNDGEYGKTISWSRYVLRAVSSSAGPARPACRRPWSDATGANSRSSMPTTIAAKASAA